ncbi:hypothetical protein D3C80_2181000 [compost metagenome]
MGNTRGDQALVSQQLGNVMGRCFAFHRGVGGEDHLAEISRLDARQQIRNAYGLGPQAVERG